MEDVTIYIISSSVEATFEILEANSLDEAKTLKEEKLILGYTNNYDTAVRIRQSEIRRAIPQLLNQISKMQNTVENLRLEVGKGE
jgi:hypothetical protein